MNLMNVWTPPRSSSTAYQTAALHANLVRLERSLRKWRETAGARVTDEDILLLAERARTAATQLHPHS